MLGVVNLDKPVGPTSHDMVALVRRLSGERRVGHAGTLDPLASGVLPILVGVATRLSEELTGGTKRYLATIRLGARSETDDSQGPIIRSGAEIPDLERVNEALEAFRGTFDQLPPAFSARKAGGMTAHRAARAGAPLELQPRRVTVESLDLLSFERSDGLADLRVEIACAAGTYVRSIARDLGESLGCGAYLSALRRTEAAGLRVADARSPEDLTALAAESRFQSALLDPAFLVPLPQLALDRASRRRFLTGLPVVLRNEPGEGRVVAVTDGELLGIGEVTGRELRPVKVLAGGISTD